MFHCRHDLIGSGAPSPQALDLTMQNNGKSGIWQGGVGLALDTSKNQVFFAVGYVLSPLLIISKLLKIVHLTTGV